MSRTPIQFHSLSLEQYDAYLKYKSHKNVFLTGPGGTGKSALIALIVADVSASGRPYQVCALTGCAALLLGGGAKTLHSWAGIGLGTEVAGYYVERICRNPFMRAAWRNIKLLIVDEVSMLSAKLFDLINAIAKRVRHSQLPFGGIQLIFVGDFYQLPPVPSATDPEAGKFCFESVDWPTTFSDDNHIILSTNFRQSDPVYQRILNQIRCGQLKRRDMAILSARVGVHYELEINGGVRPTKLFPTNNKVDYINGMEMDALPPDAPTHVYTLSYLYDVKVNSSRPITRHLFTPNQQTWELDRIAGNIPCNKELVIKQGAQVMCRVNLDIQRGICNGSQGIVIGFQSTGLTPSTTLYPVVRFTNGLEIVMGPYIWESETITGIGVEQVPLSLSWAMTIHKSQGATLEQAEVDAGSEIFECGQTYVVLSRVKSLGGLYLTAFDISRIQINGTAKAFYDRLEALCETRSHVPVPVPDPPEPKVDNAIALVTQPCALAVAVPIEISEWAYACVCPDSVEPDPDATNPDATDPDATDPDASDPDATDPNATDLDPDATDLDPDATDLDPDAFTTYNCTGAESDTGDAASVNTAVTLDDVDLR